MLTSGLPLVTIFFASLVTLALTPGLVARAFSMGWLRWLGNISYGIYIFHVLLAGLIEAITHRLAGNSGLVVNNLVRLVVAMVVSVLAAYASFHLYEKQFLRLKRYFVPTCHAPPNSPSSLAR